jgi:adenylate cyclase
MSPDPGSEYFSDGLTEELINLLARDGRLQVVARTSTFQFKGAVRDIRDIGRQLGVGKLLEGSVRRAGNRVRVTAQLINVADGCHLWSERYEGEIDDIFAIQEQIAGSIRQAVQIRLVDSVREPGRRGRTEELEAHNHYLQGRFLWNQRTGRGFKAAIDHFDQAIRLDPGFARAYSGLADCFLMLGMSAAEAPDRCMPEARTAAMRALELDAGLAEAHASLAAVKNCYEWHPAAAQKEYQSSLTLDPHYATAHHWYGLWPWRHRAGWPRPSNSSKRRSSWILYRSPSSPIWGWSTPSVGTPRPLSTSAAGPCSSIRTSTVPTGSSD